MELQTIGKWMSINIGYCQVVKQLDLEVNIAANRFTCSIFQIIPSILKYSEMREQKNGQIFFPTNNDFIF